MNPIAKNLWIPLEVSSNLLAYSAWLSDRVRGLPDLAQADNLTLSRWWKHTLAAQIKKHQSRVHQHGLFGDSISAGLGLAFSKDLFNFALGGLSSISLVEQLKVLSAANIKNDRAAIAIGTNDALYGTSDPVIFDNVNRAIELVRSMGAARIVIVGAFYATRRASQNPWLAGSNQRINEINRLLERAASQEQVHFVWDELQPLFEQNELNSQLTRDGVHLNARGKYLYEQILSDVLRLPSSLDSTGSSNASP
jgi:lysophospholipase L1-like esterase